MSSISHFPTTKSPSYHDWTRATPVRTISLRYALAAAISGLALMTPVSGRAQALPETYAQAELGEQAEPVAPGLTGAAWNIANQAYAAYVRKDYQESIRLVQEGLRLRPDSPQLWLLLMDALEADGRLDEAVAAGNRAQAAGVKDVSLQARLQSQNRLMAQEPSLAANQALTANDPEKAIIEARKAIALVPGDISYHLLLIYALIAADKTEEAEKAATAAVELDPEAFMPRILRGYLLERLGRITEANTDFDDALKDEMLSEATERDARILIADAALAARNPQRALEVLKALGQTNDPGVALRREAATALQNKPALLGKDAHAKLPVPFRQCVDTPYGPSCTLVPATTPPLPGIGNTPGTLTAQNAFDAYQKGDTAKAEKLIREALRLNPKDAIWHRLLLDTLDRSGQHALIDATLEKAIAETDNDPELVALRAQRQLTASVGRAISAINDGRPTTAVDIARTAVERVPSSIPFRIVLIRALLDTKQPQAAFEATEAALKQDGADRRARILLAWQLARQGQADAALAELSKVLATADMTETESLNFRLIAANIALSQGDGEAALAYLEPLKDVRQDNVRAYYLQAVRMQRGEKVRPPALVTPSILCQPSAYGVICGVYFGPAGASAAPGFAEADGAFRAMERRDFRLALQLARKAVRLDPNNAGYQQLLAGALIGMGQFGEAEQLLNRLLARNPHDATLLLQRASLRQQAGRHDAAIADYRAAIASGRLTAQQKRTALLSIADTALQAQNPELAIATLKAFGDAPDYDVHSRLGYALMALENREEALIAFERAERAAQDLRQKNAMLVARINVLNAMGRRDEARALFLAAYERGQLRGMDTVQLAVLASQSGENEMAFDLFEQADARNQLSGTNLIEAAYNARRTYNNERAVDYFKAAIDEAHSGKLKLDPQYLFGLRREVEVLTRTWGAYLSVNYGAAGMGPNNYLLGPTNLGSGHTLSIGGEVYWRPPHIGYRDGALFELFARGFMTGYDENDGATGLDTLQPSVGARWKPFKDQNLILEASYLFPISKFAREDVLLRAAYSMGEGGDLRVDVPDWTFWSAYVDAAYFAMNPQTIISSEARYGRSYRLDQISDRLVVTPFLALGGSYDTGFHTPFSLGVGPGVNLRYWFREDEYTAPRSYVDLTAQYRVKLAGDDRAEGLFAGAFLSY